MTLNFPEVGAHRKGQHFTFTVWAPAKKNLRLQLIDSGKEIRMIEGDLGYHSVSTDITDEGVRYRIAIDDQSFPDPASRHQPEGVHGPSATTHSEFAWNDHGWKGMPLSEMILYEIHTGTFSPSGDFDGIVERIPHLLTLGINAVEIMPIAQFPGERNWGYDGVFPFAVQCSYGGISGFKRLVDKLHEAGIAVILDVVYNHLGPEGNYLGEFAPYFTDAYKTNWGQAINFDGAWSDGVRSFYLQNATQWLEEFHVDGLRLDAVHAIYDYSARPFLKELQQQVNEISVRSGKEKILIAEVDLNSTRFISPLEAGGYGLAGQWADEFHHAVHSFLTGERNGYYEDFGSVTDIEKAVRDNYVYTGQYSLHRKKLFGELPSSQSYDQFVLFNQNHDQTGNRMLGDRLVTLVDEKKYRLAAALLLLAPQTPLLFMGEEYGESNPFQYFADHSDPELLKNVREGRKKEFAHFKWDGTIPDPFAIETFDLCKLSWTISADREKVFQFYRELISLRKKHPAFKTRKRAETTIELDNYLLKIRRSAEKSDVWIFFNLSDHPTHVINPCRLSLSKIFDRTSGDSALIPDGGRLDFPEWSVSVYETLLP